MADNYLDKSHQCFGLYSLKTGTILTQALQSLKGNENCIIIVNISMNILKPCFYLAHNFTISIKLYCFHSAYK